MNNGRSILIIVSGPSGAGKGTVVARALELAAERGLNVGLSISMTSRDMRPGEKDGETYIYVSRERFEQAIAQGEVLEYNEYSGNFYGTPARAVRDSLAAGRDIILEIDVNGRDQVAGKFGDEVVTVFILPPSMEELEKRLRLRARDSEEDIRRRLGEAIGEMKRAAESDYQITNDEVDATAERLIEIYLYEKQVIIPRFKEEQ